MGLNRELLVNGEQKTERKDGIDHSKRPMYRGQFCKSLGGPYTYESNRTPFSSHGMMIFRGINSNFVSHSLGRDRVYIMHR